MSTLTRWTPFSSSLAIPTPPRFWATAPIYRRTADAHHRLGVDVTRSDDGYVIAASLPGIPADDIDVTVDDGVLKIAATNVSDETTEIGDYVIRERRSGKFQRAIRIPRTADVDAAETSYKDGVLKIVLPTAEAKQPKRLPISS